MRVFRANLFLVLVSVLLPLGFFMAVIRNLPSHRDWPSVGEMGVVAVLCAASLLWIAYLAALRVEFTAAHITYRRLFKGEQVISLSEISSVAHEKREDSEGARYVLIVTPRLATGKPPMTIPLFLLGLRAGTELPALLAAKPQDSHELLTLTMK